MEQYTLLKSELLYKLTQIIGKRDDYYKILEIQDEAGYFTESNIPQGILDIIGGNQEAMDVYKEYIIVRNKLHVLCVKSYFSKGV